MLAVLDDTLRLTEIDPQQQCTFLEIRKGMRIFDAHGEPVGNVRWVYPGDAAEQQVVLRRNGTSSLAEDGPAQHAYVDMFAGLFATGQEEADTPLEMLAARLLHTGFARIDGEGLAPEHRYFTPDQVAHVDEQGVHLTLVRAYMRRR